MRLGLFPNKMKHSRRQMKFLITVTFCNLLFAASRIVRNYSHIQVAAFAEQSPSYENQRLLEDASRRST